MALPLLLGFGLPALAGSGVLGAGAAATFLGGLSAPTLAGIGAGLGSFLETGDVGKGIQTGLIAGLGGKAMGALTGGGNSALSGAIGGTEGAAQAAIKASAVEGGKNAFLQGITNKGLQQAAAGAVLPGVGTAALVGSAMNPPTMKMPEKEKVDVPPPMPRIRSYQPKQNMDSTAEEEMITYYNPVKRMRGGGILGLGGASQLMPQYGHPAFSTLASALAQGINSTTNEKVRPFVQEVETMAKDRFGPNIFQQQLLGTALQPTAHDQLPLYNTNFGPQPLDPFARPMRPDSNNGVDMLPNLNRIPEDAFALTELKASAMPATLRGFAEGGIVPEEMNEKELIEEAVAAIKGEADNPKEILGLFLLKFGEEQLRNLVESVQSGELDETRERFAEGDKGMVNGPGDGSGKDDMVPATMDGDQDVLLTAGEFVIKKDSTDAIEKAFGGGFLDEVNDAGKDAPKKLKEKVAVA